ncbi:MAG: Mrp/NBP35 family ATP-binding protein [Haloferacaceae archaeon]
MDEAAVRERLRAVEDPDLGGDIVSLGLVNAVDVDDERVRVSLALGAPYSPTESRIAARVREELADDAGGREIQLTARIDEPEPARPDAATGEADAEEDDAAPVLPGVKNVVAVASGKGGVGKSTVAVNLAAGLSKLGARVGLFDADIYGPNVPRMVDADEAPRATAEERIVPPEKYGMKLMSMAFLVGEDDPVIWRGPMVHKVLTQLVEDVEWGELDYMILDLPPGTGDTQLTILQTLPLAGAVVVTTPQDVAVDDARKGLRMFDRHDTTVLGVVENMAGFRCPDCGSAHDLFGRGGGAAFARTNDLALLGSIPLDPEVRAGGDEGAPAVLGDGEAADSLRVATENVADAVGLVKRREVAERRGGDPAERPLVDGADDD